MAPRNCRRVTETRGLCRKASFKFSSDANFSKKPSLLSSLNKLLNSSIFHIYFIVAFILYLSPVLLDLKMLWHPFWQCHTHSSCLISVESDLKSRF